MPATLEPTLSLNLLTPKTLERLGGELPPGFYAPLRWYVFELADALRPALGARHVDAALAAIEANLAKVAVVRMRLIDLFAQLLGGDGKQFLALLRDMQREVSDEFLDGTESLAGKTASLYLAQALSLIEGGLSRVERAAQTPSGVRWTLHADEEITLRTWTLRTEALLMTCAIGVSEPENVADESVFAELCRECYEAASRQFGLLERALSLVGESRASTDALLDDFKIEEPSWVHALEADERGH
jgi:hypothetical protein